MTLPRTRHGGSAAPAAALLAGLLAVLLAGCTGTRPLGPAAGPDRTAPPPGCGITAPRLLTGLLGPGARSVSEGSLAALRRAGTPATCRTTSRPARTASPAGPGPAGRARSVSIRVVRHPAPLTLPSLDCDQGWVYAGTPRKYVPACQQGRGRGGRTVLLARWGDYVVRVDIARDNRAWGGDPELGLALSRDVARRLGVGPPGDGGSGAQSASGSSS